MKLICILVSFMLSSVAVAQEIYNLEWKLAPGEVMAYKTKVAPPEGAKKSFLKLDVDQIINKKELDPQTKREISQIEFPDEGNMTSIMESQSDGTISIKLIVDTVTLPKISGDDSNEMQARFRKMMKDMEGTVQLQGAIDKRGQVESFYLAQKQKNLLAMMFELPDRPVKIGDKWPIHFNCIEMGGGFIPGSAGRVNQVELVDVVDNNVAQLDYLITEKVTGTFQNPAMNKEVPITMTCSYIGRHEFLIDEGRWKSVSAEFVINSAGFAQSNSQNIVSMTPVLDK